MFAWMALEYFTWDSRELEWQRELMFHEQFGENDDVDERQLRLSIQLLTQPMTASQRKTAAEVFKNSQRAQ